MNWRFLYVLLLVLCMNNAQAQLSTNNSKSADDLVRNILAGDGVEISNVTYSGSSLSIGEFFGASSNIGLDHGIILSTGTVLDGVDGAGRKNGPVGPNNNPSAATKQSLAGDDDLSQLVGGSKSYDAAILEFDFVPEGDTVRFRYVFGSEEYPEWVGSANNDAFGFFISGAGISGKKNIALLPDGSTVVSINNVNIGANSSYFVYNGTGFSGTPQFSDEKAVNFNGFTVVLEAVAKVTPCQTYHLKIVIADLVDDHMDSGVFLEANSLNSVPKFEIKQAVDFSPSGSTVEIFEGCSKGEIRINREDKINNTLTVPFNVYGSAAPGVDYDPIASSITFSPGEKAKRIIINPIRDALNDDGETIILRFKNPSVCESDSIDFTYTIKDQPTLVTKTGGYFPVCPKESTSIVAEVTGGVKDYEYTWATGESGATLSVNPQTTSTYYYSVKDACGQLNSDSVLVTVPVYGPVVVVSMNDTIIRCRGKEVRFKAEATGGAGQFSYLWNDGQTNQVSKNQILNDGPVSVVITDQCGESVTDDAMVTLNYPVFNAHVNADTLICQGDSIVLQGSATGGVPPYRYLWEGSSGTSYKHIGNTTETVKFLAYDSCGIIPAEEEVVVTVQKPLASFEINAPLPEPNEIIYFLNNSERAVRYLWDFGNQGSSIEKNPTTVYTEIDTFQVILSVFDELSCLDTTSLSIVMQHPLYFYIPNSFTPDDNGFNDNFEAKGIGITELQLTIFDRSGGVVFDTTDPNFSWDGTFSSGKKAPTEVYVVKYTVKSSYRPDKVYKSVKTITLVR